MNNFEACSILFDMRKRIEEFLAIEKKNPRKKCETDTPEQQKFAEQYHLDRIEEYSKQLTALDKAGAALTRRNA